MTINLERSIHPDLLEETLAEAEAASAAPPVANRRRRRQASAPSPESSPPGDAQAPVDGAEGDSGEDMSPSPEPSSPEWLQSVRDAQDPTQMLALLLQNLPTEEVIKDSRLQGYVGNRISMGVREKLEEQARQQQDRERQQAYERGDLYSLGQYEAQSIQQQREALARQAEAAMNPYLQAITSFQQTLPEAVQRDVQGKTYAPGGTPQEGFAAYLQAVHESALRHGVEDEVRKREPALRKAELNGTVGGEMTPELDGGPAQAYREITDAQVAAMTLQEFDRYFDDKGRPRPGVRVQLTRGIDVRREQRR